jgi:hypothetical protein
MADLWDEDSLVVAPDGRVAVVGPDGRAGLIPREQLEAAIRDYGFRPEEHDEHEERRLDTEYGDAPVQAAVEGVLRTATFGLSDAVARAAGAEEGVRERAKRNPLGSGIGEVGGYLTPGGAGQVIGRGLLKATGAGAAKTVAGRALRTGAAGAIENTAFHVGQGTISDVSLSEKQINAEFIAASIGRRVQGVPLAAGIGFGAGGIGSLLADAAAAVKARATSGVNAIDAEAKAAPEFDNIELARDPRGGTVWGDPADLTTIPPGSGPPPAPADAFGIGPNDLRTIRPGAGPTIRDRVETLSPRDYTVDEVGPPVDVTELHPRDVIPDGTTAIGKRSATPGAATPASPPRILEPIDPADQARSFREAQEDVSAKRLRDPTLVSGPPDDVRLLQWLQGREMGARLDAAPQRPASALDETGVGNLPDFGKSGDAPSYKPTKRNVDEAIAETEAKIAEYDRKIADLSAKEEGTGLSIKPRPAWADAKLRDLMKYRANAEARLQRITSGEEYLPPGRDTLIRVLRDAGGLSGAGAVFGRHRQQVERWMKALQVRLEDAGLKSGKRGGKPPKIENEAAPAPAAPARPPEPTPPKPDDTLNLRRDDVLARDGEDGIAIPSRTPIEEAAEAARLEAAGVLGRRGDTLPGVRDEWGYVDMASSRSRWAAQDQALREMQEAAHARAAQAAENLEQVVARETSKNLKAGNAAEPAHAPPPREVVKAKAEHTAAVKMAADIDVAYRRFAADVERVANRAALNPLRAPDGTLPAVRPGGDVPIGKWSGAMGNISVPQVPRGPGDTAMRAARGLGDAAAGAARSLDTLVDVVPAGAVAPRSSPKGAARAADTPPPPPPNYRDLGTPPEYRPRGGDDPGVEVMPPDVVFGSGGKRIEAPTATAPEGKLGWLGDMAPSAGGLVGFGVGQLFGHPWIGAGIGRAAGHAVKHYLAKGAKLDPALRAHVAKASGLLADGMRGFAVLAPKMARAASSPTSPLATLKDVSYAPLDGETTKPRKGTSKLLAEFERLRDEVMRAVSDMPGTLRRTHDLLLGVRDLDPKLADGIADVQQKKLDYLAKTLPPSPMMDGVGRRAPLSVSEAVASDWIRGAAALEDPVGRVTAEMKAGRLSPSTVKAVKAVYPEVYAAFQSAILENLVEIQKTLPYHARLQLGILFEVPADSSLRIVAEMQSRFAQEPGTEGGQRPPTANLGDIKAPEPTEAQRLSA